MPEKFITPTTPEVPVPTPEQSTEQKEHQDTAPGLDEQPKYYQGVPTFVEPGIKQKQAEAAAAAPAPKPAGFELTRELVGKALNQGDPDAVKNSDPRATMDALLDSISQEDGLK